MKYPKLYCPPKIPSNPSNPLNSCELSCDGGLLAYTAKNNQTYVHCESTAEALAAIKASAAQAQAQEQAEARAQTGAEAYVGARAEAYAEARGHARD